MEPTGSDTETFQQKGMFLDFEAGGLKKSEVEAVSAILSGSRFA